MKQNDKKLVGYITSSLPNNSFTIDLAYSMKEAGVDTLHGGIGMTEEYAVGHYLRRIHVLDQMFGDADAHAARLAAALL